MFETIVMVILVIAAVISFAVAAKGGKIIAGIVGVVALIAAGLVLIFSTLFFQSQGQAKVIVNADGTIAGQSLQPGSGWKAPWQSFVEYDLFSQEVVYAGGDGEAPSYSGGTVSGKEVTVAVGGVSGGSTQANVDISITYSLDADKVTDLYSKYKTQERFTKQIVEKTILSTIREIPAEYNAIEFRGEKRAEATDKMLKSLNAKLNKHGVTVDFVNLQDIRYSESVQTALNEVENASQAVQKAEAEQRKVTVEAETARIKAQGVADSNAILDRSLTDAILQQRLIEAYGEGTVYVTDGSPVIINKQ